MSSCESGAFESYADKLLRSDKFLTHVRIYDWEILGALKINSVVKKVSIIGGTILDLPENQEAHLDPPENQEAHIKMSEVMKCNKSVESLRIGLPRGLLRESLFATTATSGGWRSIKDFVLYDSIDYDPLSLSLREAEHISSFIIQSENLRAFQLDVLGDGTGPIVEALYRTKVQSLVVRFHSALSLQNGGRRFAAALERCTCITELRLQMPFYGDQVDFFQILLAEAIPKVLGLKKLHLQMRHRSNQ